MLTTSKSAASYTDIFRFIERHFPLQPKEFMSDFESGLRKSLKVVYPNVILRGCLFHYSACIRKRAMSLGLLKHWNKKAMEDNPKTALETKKIYKLLLKLPLLPQESFLNGYEYVQKVAKRSRLSKSFENLFKYFNRTWVKEVRKI